MFSMAAASAALLLQAANGSAPTQGPWLLTCDVATSGSGGSGHAADQRTFRLGPNLFQEWKPETKAFGPNLCSSFACKADAGRLEGVLSGATLTLTITLDPQARQATWRTVGASGLARTSGPCTLAADTTGAKSGP